MIELFNSIEIPLINVLASMESEGVCLDVEFLKTLSIDLNNDIKNLEEKFMIKLEKFLTSHLQNNWGPFYLKN